MSLMSEGLDVRYDVFYGIASGEARTREPLLLEVAVNGPCQREVVVHVGLFAVVNSVGERAVWHN